MLMFENVITIPTRLPHLKDGLKQCDSKWTVYRKPGAVQGWEWVTWQSAQESVGGLVMLMKKSHGLGTSIHLSEDGS